MKFYESYIYRISMYIFPVWKCYILYAKILLLDIICWYGMYWLCKNKTVFFCYSNILKATQGARITWPCSPLSLPPVKEKTMTTNPWARPTCCWTKLKETTWNKLTWIKPQRSSWHNLTACLSKFDFNG